MATTTMKRSEFRALLKQAKREQDAHEAGYLSHAAMVEAHRLARRQKLLERRDAVRAAGMA